MHSGSRPTTVGTNSGLRPRSPSKQQRSPLGRITTTGSAAVKVSSSSSGSPAASSSSTVITPSSNDNGGVKTVPQVKVTKVEGSLAVASSGGNPSPSSNIKGVLDSTKATFESGLKINVKGRQQQQQQPFGIETGRKRPSSSSAASSSSSTSTSSAPSSPVVTSSTPKQVGARKPDEVVQGPQGEQQAPKRSRADDGPVPDVALLDKGSQGDLLLMTVSDAKMTDESSVEASSRVDFKENCKRAVSGPSLATTTTTGSSSIKRAKPGISMNEVIKLHQDEGVLHLLHGLPPSRRKLAAANPVIASTDRPAAAAAPAVVASNPSLSAAGTSTATAAAAAAAVAAVAATGHTDSGVLTSYTSLSSHGATTLSAGNGGIGSSSRRASGEYFQQHQADDGYNNKAAASTAVTSTIVTGLPFIRRFSGPDPLGLVQCQSSAAKGPPWVPTAIVSRRDKLTLGRPARKRPKQEQPQHHQRRRPLHHHHHHHHRRSTAADWDSQLGALDHVDPCTEKELMTEEALKLLKLLPSKDYLQLLSSSCRYSLVSKMDDRVPLIASPLNSAANGETTADEASPDSTSSCSSSVSNSVSNCQNGSSPPQPLVLVPHHRLWGINTKHMKDVVVRTYPSFVQVMLAPVTTGLRHTLNANVCEELMEVCRQAEAEDGCRAVVVSGLGHSTPFCLGVDLSALSHEGTPEKQRKAAEAMAGALKRLCRFLLMYPKVLVAAVNGPARGFGVVVLPLFDVVYASDKATFSTDYSRLGQIPEAMAAETFGLVCNSKAACNEALLFGRTFTANQAAERLGIVSDVLWPDKFLEELAPRVEQLASLNFEGIRAVKESTSGFLRKRLSPQLLDQEARDLVRCWTNPGFAKSIKQFLKSDHGFVFQ